MINHHALKVLLAHHHAQKVQSALPPAQKVLSAHLFPAPRVGLAHLPKSSSLLKRISQLTTKVKSLTLHALKVQSALPPAQKVLSAHLFPAPRVGLAHLPKSSSLLKRISQLTTKVKNLILHALLVLSAHLINRRINQLTTKVKSLTPHAQKVLPAHHHAQKVLSAHHHAQRVLSAHLSPALKAGLAHLPKSSLNSNWHKMSNHHVQKVPSAHHLAQKVLSAHLSPAPKAGLAHLPNSSS